jgi:hypothetical protein
MSFWVHTTCGLVDTYQCFGETYWFHLQDWSQIALNLCFFFYWQTKFRLNKLTHITTILYIVILVFLVSRQKEAFLLLNPLSTSVTLILICYRRSQIFWLAFWEFIRHLHSPTWRNLTSDRVVQRDVFDYTSNQCAVVRSIIVWQDKRLQRVS